MFRATLKSLLSRKLRLTLSGLAVVLGVMFVSGSYVLTDTLQGSFDSMFTNAFSSIDVAVSPKTQTAAEETGQTTPSLPASVMDKVRTVPGVSGVTGQINVDGARLIGSNGKVVTTMGAPRFGTNWQGEDSFVQLREGRGPTADNEIAINAGLARAGNVHVGDQVGVLTLQPKRTFTLVGIFGYAGGKDTMSSAHQVAFTTPVAQELMLGQANHFTSLSLTTAKGTSAAAVRDSVQSALGGEYTVQTRAQLEKDAKDQYSSGLGFFNKILLGFAAVALFVGAFLIVNTFSIIIAQRTRELALMRAIGASRRQIIGSVLIEATAIGLIASFLGLLAGIGVGSLLGWIFGKITELSTSGAKVPMAAVISAFAVGIPITVIAAVLPAFRASRVAPVAAMHEVSAVDRPMTKLTISGALVTALGAGMLAVGLNSDNSSLLLIGGGVLVSFLGVALLAPSLARPAAQAIGWLFSWSAPGKLGRLNSRRNPRRTAITAAALMIGVALIAGMSVIVSSVNTTLRTLAKSDVKVDLFTGAEWNGSGPRPTFDRSILDRTARIDGVKRVVGEYDDVANVTIPNRDQAMDYIAAYTDLPAIVDMWSLKVVSGALPLGRDQALLDEQRAKQYHLTTGSTVTMEFGKGGARTVTISGTYKSGLMNGWLVSSDNISDFVGQQPAWSFIELADGASASQVRSQLTTLLADSPEITITSTDGLVDQATKETKQVLTMVQVMLGLAILIAVLGIINTLALSIIERTRELGMLRAIGLRRAQMMRMVTVESIIISLFGALLGLGVGSGLGIAIVKALKSEGITRLSLPWSEFGLYLAIAAVVGVIAAVIPAIRAARVNVLAAIASE